MIVLFVGFYMEVLYIDVREDMDVDWRYLVAIVIYVGWYLTSK